MYKTMYIFIPILFFFLELKESKFLQKYIIYIKVKNK